MRDDEPVARRARAHVITLFIILYIEYTARIFFMPRGSRSNPLSLAVFALLFERPMHPYEISQTLRERHKHDSIKLNYGALYAVVDALAERGYIEAGETQRSGKRPERTVYSITAGGRAELRDWMRELVRAPVKEFTHFEAGLALAPVLPPDELIKLLRERLERLNREIEESRSTHAEALKLGVDPLFLVEDEYREALRSAERAWVKDYVRRLEAGEFEIMDAWRAWHEGGPHPAEARHS
jgi:DNA-binding PadR family transcriptional regulator